MGQPNKKTSFILAIVAAVAGAVAGLASRYAAGDLGPAQGAELGADAIECVNELTAWSESKGRKVSKASAATFCVALVATPKKQ